MTRAGDTAMSIAKADLDPAPVGGETDVRAVVRDELAKAEAERRQRLDDFKSGIGSPLFVNLGTSEEDMARLNCPACGGSGHIDDVAPTPPPAEPDNSKASRTDVLLTMLERTELANMAADLEQRLAEAEATLAERDRRIAELEAGLKPFGVDKGGD